MKKSILILLMIAILASLVSGCGHKAVTKETTNTDSGETTVCVSRAEGMAYSEEEFFNGILRNTGAYEAWGLLEYWEYYYRLVYIPEGFELESILFAGGYLVYNYRNEADELFEFVWNRGLGEEAVRDYRGQVDGIEVEIPGTKDDMYIIASSGMDFSEAKNNKEWRENRKSSIYSDAWGIAFSTDGNMFLMGLPFSIPEEDLGKIIQVERVYIKK